MHRFARSVRRLLSAAATSRPGAQAWEEAAGRVASAAALLAPHQGPEERRLYGQVREYAGRGQVLAPVIDVVDAGPDHLIGSVTLDTYYLGRGAAHGGVQPLLFDEVLGHLANAGDRRPARTAYLHVNYRAITPVGRRLTVAATVDREDGRKRFLSARLLDEDRLLCDAEGLFVELRPDQP